MQGCLTKFRILFHCLLDGGQFKMSRGGDGGLSVAALSALAGRPRRAPVLPGSPGPAFSSLGLRPRLPLDLSGSGVFSLAAFPFFSGSFSLSLIHI